MSSTGWHSMIEQKDYDWAVCVTEDAMKERAAIASRKAQEQLSMTMTRPTGENTDFAEICCSAKQQCNLPFDPRQVSVTLWNEKLEVGGQASPDGRGRCSLTRLRKYVRLFTCKVTSHLPFILEMSKLIGENQLPKTLESEEDPNNIAALESEFDTTNADVVLDGQKG